MRGAHARVALAGTIGKAEIEKTYKISRRIEAEERGLDSAMMVFTSTQQEVDEQWGLYEGWVRLASCTLERWQWHTSPISGRAKEALLAPS